MKFIHTADLHIGQILYQYYDRVDEHEYFFAQLRRWCIEHKPDALLVCGDIFDIQQPSASVKEFFNRTFAEIHLALPSMAIVVIAGNHDSASRIQADSAVWDLSGVTIVGQPPASTVVQMDDGWQDEYIVEIASGFIVALPFSPIVRPEVIQSLLDRVSARNVDAKPVVMMGHMAVSGSDWSGHDEVGNQRIVDVEQLGCGFDYVALGHIHRSQTLGFNISDEMQPSSVYRSGVVRYSGSPLHVSCDERYPHTVSLVNIASHGGDVELSRLRVDEYRHFFILPDMTSSPADNAEEVYAMVDDFCAAHARGYFRLRIAREAKLPPDFMQTIYKKIEGVKGGDIEEIRFNPNIISEDISSDSTNDGGDVYSAEFELAELQQMNNPLTFVLRTIEQYPNIDRDTIEADFAEIEEEVRRMTEDK